jgi:putative endonuclease
MFFVYVLGSKSTGKHYIGQTDNIERRFSEHEQGLAGYTRGRGPWELLIVEEYSTRSEAMVRERFLKSGQGREWLKEKLNGSASPPEADNRGANYF